MIGDIFHELKHLEKEIKKMLSEYPRAGITSFFPPIDIFEKKGEIKIYVDLPGFNIEDLKLEIEEKHLFIKGTKKIDKTGDKGLNFICLERKFGNFERRIFLGKEPDTEKIEAILSKGVLKISIPFKQEKSTKVEIKIREEE